MKELKITKHTAEAEGNTVYALHESGKYRKGEMEMCNRFYATVYPDYARGVTIEEAEANAALFAEAINVANQCGLTPKELLEQQQHSKEVIEELVKALEESNTQIEYLHQKFKETGTGNAVLSRNSTIIQKHRNNEKQG